MPHRFSADDFPAIRARVEELRRLETDTDTPASSSPEPAASLSQQLANADTPSSARRLLLCGAGSNGFVSDLDVLRAAALLV